MKWVAHGIAAVLALALISCGTNDGRFSLVNKSTELIARAFVAIGDQTIQLTNIQPNESAEGSYKVRPDSHYRIRVEFQSGTPGERNRVCHEWRGFSPRDYSH